MPPVARQQFWHRRHLLLYINICLSNYLLLRVDFALIIYNNSVQKSKAVTAKSV
jgi:hypothetical protein